eukprot:CAMPEP_0175938534 /NCGR_PEP_ID=MMETSP0108-20121206/22745_1 /TAXON_ID=195067 ORGANISM="Goniomonas pacifica, Strain CCMP1869" /NCGR_SAMPLE_ID=MMETSP0108 /ASSEMBLY_ACC=CAM_ASM_000204 /LENGTH=283 /DNA_ID=CAMNT_0017262787 /DNA_START=1 /DNA_END=852 /DNA_ORIENTATION=-
MRSPQRVLLSVGLALALLAGFAVVLNSNSSSSSLALTFISQEHPKLPPHCSPNGRSDAVAGIFTQMDTLEQGLLRLKGSVEEAARTFQCQDMRRFPRKLQKFQSMFRLVRAQYQALPRVQQEEVSMCYASRLQPTIHYLHRSLENHLQECSRAGPLLDQARNLIDAALIKIKKQLAAVPGSNCKALESELNEFMTTTKDMRRDLDHVLAELVAHDLTLLRHRVADHANSVVMVMVNSFPAVWDQAWELEHCPKHKKKAPPPAVDEEEVQDEEIEIPPAPPFWF